MARIGILTMHKVVNYGSALQAYALQQYISSIGIDNEIIDLDFSPGPKGLKSWVRYIVKGNFIMRYKFRRFWKKYYKLSHNHYKKNMDLSDCSCRYDIYLTGSDQVWNPNHNGDELTYMFDFINNNEAIKISYAASFATDNVPIKYVSKYKSCLSQYKAISVREENALPLIKQLTGKEGELVCDPTFLFDAKFWDGFGRNSKLKIHHKYVLFYILTYAYDPYPQINGLIEKIQNTFNGYHFVFLGGKIKDRKRRNSIVIDNVSPYDFVYLIENADFVVTTSFHGTAFSINFRRPFYSVVHSDLKSDDRMYSLLKRIGLEQRAIKYDKDFHFTTMFYDEKVETRLNEFINKSKSFLKSSLN